MCLRPEIQIFKYVILYHFTQSVTAYVNFVVSIHKCDDGAERKSIFINIVQDSQLLKLYDSCHKIYFPDLDLLIVGPHTLK